MVLLSGSTTKGASSPRQNFVKIETIPACVSQWFLVLLVVETSFGACRRPSVRGRLVEKIGMFTHTEQLRGGSRSVVKASTVTTAKAA